LQRAELLANLVLTRRKDVQVLSFGDQADVGIDLLARIDKPLLNGQFLPSFAVQVLGTADPLADEESASRYVNRRWKHRPPRFGLLCPIAVFLFSMDGDVGYYGWLMEPHVTKEEGPRLTLVSPLGMMRINKRVIDDLIDRVEKWFEAVAETFVEHAPPE
jgi:hypothetical protein